MKRNLSEKLFFLPSAAYLMVVAMHFLSCLGCFDCEYAVDDEAVECDVVGQFVRSHLIGIHCDDDRCLLLDMAKIPLVFHSIIYPFVVDHWENEENLTVH